MSRTSTRDKNQSWSWPFFAASLLVLQVILDLVSGEPKFRLAADSLVLLIFLMVATRVAAQSAWASQYSIRLFWAFIATGSVLWAINSLMGIFYAAGMGIRADLIVSGSILFLHTVLMLGAVACLPHVKQRDRGVYGTTLNLFFLLFFWEFVYLFFMLPGQNLNWSTGVRWFSLVYFAENIILAIAALALTLQTRSFWRSVYLPLFWSSALYAVSSLVANLNIANKIYAPGLLGTLQSGSAGILAWAAIRGREVAPQLAETVTVKRHRRFYPAFLAMLAVTIVPVFGVWDELARLKQHEGAHTIRLLAVLIGGLLLAWTVFIRQFFQQRKSAMDIGLARDQLHLAMQCGKSMGWDLDMNGGEGTWFGDLKTFCGIPATTYEGPAKNFYLRVHADDRRRVLRAISQAVHSKRSYAVVFRVVLPNGATRWVTSHGRFYYKANDQPTRMLGIAVDVEEQKRTEAALREKEDKLRLVLESAAEGIYGVDEEGRCTFCNPAALNMLGRSRAEELMGQDVHEHIHHTRPDGTPYPRNECPIMGVLQTGQGIHAEDEVFWRADGTHFPVEYWSFPQRRGADIAGSVVTFVDITERRRAEESLRESELRFRNVANTAPVLLWMSGQDEVRNYFNQSWLEFTGVSPGSQWENGRLKCIHADDWETYSKTYSECFQARQPFRIEYRLKRHDGEYRWILENSIPRFGFNGVFEGYIGCAIDLTEVRRAENEIALANERLQMALEAGRAIVWDLELKTGKSILFGKHEMLFGRAKKIETEPEFWDCVHPEDREQLRRSLDVAREERTIFSEEYRVLWPDGTLRWLHTEGKYLYSGSGKPERLSGITVDVTERRRTEEALQYSQEELNLAFEAARLGWWVWNEETGHLVLSEGAKTVLASSEAEIELQGFLNSVHPEDRERVYQTWRQSLEQGTYYVVEYRVLQPDGAIRWVETRCHTFRDSRGRSLQLVGISMDISERKRAEEALRTLGGRLIEAQEQERIRIARELHDDVCQRLALLGMELERLKDIPELSDRKLRSSVDHLVEFTEEIATSVQAISHELHSSKLEILGTTAAMKSFCAEFADRYHVTVEFSGDSVSHLLSREASICLYRILQEGLHNAVKHSGARHFFAQLRQRSGAVELTVKDLGVGFDPQAATTGQGLGLVSMRERVKLIDGTFSIETAPMRGTTIRASVKNEEGTFRMTAV